MRASGVFSSQQLSAYEQRMMISVYRANVALAREIDARWAPDAFPIIAELLVRWRNTISDLILRFNEVIIRDSAGFMFQFVGQKNQQLEFLLNFIRPELRRYSNRTAAVIEGYLRDRIAKELASGKTQKEVRESIDRILKSRGYARRIAHTEAHTALERGMWEAANSLGARMTKEWVSREDILVRPAHAAAHGQIVFINQSFLVGGESLMFPGDPSASARNRVNCRCTSNYRLD
jgi:Phage Mu protein F like protein.